MIRLWGQAQFSLATKRLSGYELFLREQTLGGWRLPANIASIAPAEMTTLLAQTLATMPTGLDFVAFNLDQTQFIDADYLDLLRQVAATLPFRLGIELTEHHGDEAKTVTLASLVAAARRFAAAGFVVCLDDVGTGENTAALADALDPYVSEYKFALQNLRQQSAPEALEATVDFWRQRAATLHKQFTLEGLESMADRALILRFVPDYVQGYYFGTPHPLTVVDDLSLA